MMWLNNKQCNYIRLNLDMYINIFKERFTYLTDSIEPAHAILELMTLQSNKDSSKHAQMCTLTRAFVTSLQEVQWQIQRGFRGNPLPVPFLNILRK